jgi:hypothetical protein
MESEFSDKLSEKSPLLGAQGENHVGRRPFNKRVIVAGLHANLADELSATSKVVALCLGDEALGDRQISV